MPFCALSGDSMHHFTRVNSKFAAAGPVHSGNGASVCTVDRLCALNVHCVHLLFFPGVRTVNRTDVQSVDCTTRCPQFGLHCTLQFTDVHIVKDTDVQSVDCTV